MNRVIFLAIYIISTILLITSGIGYAEFLAYPITIKIAAIVTTIAFIAFIHATFAMRKALSTTQKCIVISAQYFVIAVIAIAYLYIITSKFC